MVCDPYRVTVVYSSGSCRYALLVRPGTEGSAVINDEQQAIAMEMAHSDAKQKSASSLFSRTAAPLCFIYATVYVARSIELVTPTREVMLSSALVCEFVFCLFISRITQKSSTAFHEIR